MPVTNDSAPSCVRRPGASPSGFDLVGLAADLVTLGLGRIVALYDRLSPPCQIH